MPRNVLLTCDRYLTDKVTPGNRIKIVGILSITKQQKDNMGRGSGV
jgi:DNA replication licensing factor MCM5